MWFISFSACRGHQAWYSTRRIVICWTLSWTKCPTHQPFFAASLGLHILGNCLNCKDMYANIWLSSEVVKREDVWQLSRYVGTDIATLWFNCPNCQGCGVCFMRARSWGLHELCGHKAVQPKTVQSPTKCIWPRVAGQLHVAPRLGHPRCHQCHSWSEMGFLHGGLGAAVWPTTNHWSCRIRRRTPSWQNFARCGSTPRVDQDSMNTKMRLSSVERERGLEIINVSHALLDRSNTEHIAQWNPTERDLYELITVTDPTCVASEWSTTFYHSLSRCVVSR